jgi:hypothetical protein
MSSGKEGLLTEPCCFLVPQPEDIEANNLKRAVQFTILPELSTLLRTFPPHNAVHISASISHLAPEYRVAGSMTSLSIAFFRNGLFLSAAISKRKEQGSRK